MSDSNKFSHNPTNKKSQNLSENELTEHVKWHIDRYDRLRTSTSTRASVLLSANAALISGILLLTNHYLRVIFNITPLLVDITFALIGMLCVALVLRSLWGCIDAIAARKTTRSLHAAEIPSRFLFNWGDTLRSVDGYSNFSQSIKKLTEEDILNHATSELWSDILQHSKRHSRLRMAISYFRYTVISFFILATLIFASTTIWQ